MATKSLLARQLFAEEHGAPVMDVHHFRGLAVKRAKLVVNEMNGHPHPNAVDQKNKTECAKLWSDNVDVVAKEMTNLVKRWGFNHLDFGVGLYPTLQLGESQTEGTVMFPYDD